MKLSKMKRRLTGFSMFAVMGVSLFSAGADVLSVKAAEAATSEEMVNATEAATETEVAEETRVDAGVAINETNFPDGTFRKYVKQFDTDGNGSFSSNELSAVTEIYVAGEWNEPGDITSLKGVEYFTALTNLCCDYNQLTSLDVSKNTALDSMSCSSNQLTSLDVSKNTALCYLGCRENQLTSLDVSKNTALTGLDCVSNQLTSLDVSKNTALTSMSCSNNQLTSLDVSKNTALDSLSCELNELKSLDISKNIALNDIICDIDALTSIDACKDIKKVSLCMPLYKKENSYYFDLLETLLDKTKISSWGIGEYDSTSGRLTVPESILIKEWGGESGYVQISYDFSGEKKKIITLWTHRVVSLDSYAEYQGYSFYEDENGDKYCLDSNGNRVINEFKCDGTYTYYFQADGTAMRDRLTYHPDGVNVIYFDEEGHEVFSNFHEVKKSIAGDAVNDLCFFDVYGHMYVDVMTYGNAAFGNGDKIYYINPYGVIERNGWFGFSDTCVWAGTDKKVGMGIGYANADGSLMINQHTYYNGNLVYMQGDGHIQ